MSTLGILMLDTAFPRIPGDLGAPETYAVPVRIATVPGADVDGVVEAARAELIPAFIAAGQRLAASGCAALATTCGFLVRWQDELTAALPVPILTSALLQLPLVERLLPRGRRAGIVTYSSAALDPATLAAAGIDSDAPIAGVAPDGYFATTIREGAGTLDRDRMEADVVAAARRLVSHDHRVGAIVLECANMPPYRRAVHAATGLPVFDAALLVHWFFEAATGQPTTPTAPLW